MTHERRGKSNEWFTPKYIFDAFGEVFDRDVAHPEDHAHTNVPARAFLYPRSQGWPWNPKDFVWMNQPFGNGDRAKKEWLVPFLRHANGIALTPDRTSAAWFRECWELADLCMFVPKIDFVRGDGSIGTEPGTGTCFWACGERAVAALYRAAPILGGILAKPERLAA